MKIRPGFIGIDVSKHHLDIFDPALGRVERLANEPPAIAERIARWRDDPPFVLFEATGRYDAILRHALDTAGIAFARVNPTRARDFARAAGFLAKTDAVDATMLAAMAQALAPEPQPSPAPDRARLTRLAKRRDQLVATRQKERNRHRECDDPDIAADIEHHLAWLDEAIAAIERRIERHVADTPELDRTTRLLRSVPGVGPVTATVLAALMPELGTRSHKALAALAGLAPFNNDSGKRRGQRSIRGGRKRVRDALYVAAFVAVRTATPFKTFYNRLIQAGKPRKLALIAVARKLLTTLNAMIRHGKAFQPIEAS